MQRFASMGIKYTAEELDTMELTLYDGMPVDELHSLLFPRKKTAIAKKAQDFNYGTKTIDGVQCFYYGIKNRNRRTKAEIGEVSSERTTIVGEARVTAITQEPTTLERTNQNISDDIVANKATDTTKNELLSIYDDITSLFGNTKYSSLQSVTVALTHTTITLTKDPL